MPRPPFDAIVSKDYHRATSDDVAVERDGERLEASSRAGGVARVRVVAEGPPQLTSAAAQVFLVILRGEFDRRSTTENGRSVCDIEALAS